MKSLDQKAAEFAARITNQSGSYTKGEIETAYIIGADEREKLALGETGSFSQALESLKRGYLVTRLGWNGKGMFIFMRPADELPIDFVANSIKSLPQSVKNYYSKDLEYKSNDPIEAKNDVVKFTPYICMKAADGSIVNGWLTSQTDILSDDWMIFEF